MKFHGLMLWGAICFCCSCGNKIDSDEGDLSPHAQFASDEFVHVWIEAPALIAGSLYPASLVACIGLDDGDSVPKEDELCGRRVADADEVTVYETNVDDPPSSVLLLASVDSPGGDCEDRQPFVKKDGIVDAKCVLSLAGTVKPGGTYDLGLNHKYSANLTMPLTEGFKMIQPVDQTHIQMWNGDGVDIKWQPPVPEKFENGIETKVQWKIDGIPQPDEPDCKGLDWSRMKGETADASELNVPLNNLPEMPGSGCSALLTASRASHVFFNGIRGDVWGRQSHAVRIRFEPFEKSF